MYVALVVDDLDRKHEHPTVAANIGRLHTQLIGALRKVTCVNLSEAKDVPSCGSHEVTAIDHGEVLVRAFRVDRPEVAWTR
jgi:ribosomal protein S12